METFSLEPRESVWLNGGAERLSTACGPELGRRKGQAQLRTTAVCRGLTVAQGDFLVARLTLMPDNTKMLNPSSMHSSIFS